MTGIGHVLSETVGSAPLAERLPPYTVEPHTDDARHLLLWQVFGESDVVLAEERFNPTADRALWVPAGTRHGFTTSRDAVLLPVFFPAQETATTLDGPLVVPVDSGLARLLLADLQSRYTIIRPDLDVARQILARVENGRTESGGPPMPTSTPAHRIAEALILDPGDRRTVPELAASVHIPRGRWSGCSGRKRG